MIKSQLNNSVQPNVEFPSLPKEQTVKAILNFLEIYLPQFNKIFLSESPSIHKEDDISRELFEFLLDNIENFLIRFEAKEGVDFVIKIKPYIMTADSIFLIEAKRMPTHSRDYVQGDNGGIERFKRELPGYGKHLLQSAMLGYIQEKSKDYWLKRINGWIDEKITNESDINWDDNDKLRKNEEFADFISQHSRITQPPITLHHYWLILHKE